MPKQRTRVYDPELLVPLLEESLGRDLPGTVSQMEMAPRLRQSVPAPGDHPRESAVLALLHLIDQPGDNQDVALTFTLRPRSLRHHGGQISFPGGRAEREDGSYVHTALRETQEELGIATQGIRILGEMTPLFIAPSQNLVHPFVGWIRALPPLHPSPAEVDRVLQIPLTSLLKPEAVDTYQWQHNGALRSAPCFRVGDVIIWGATAMMLNELLEVIRRIRG